MGPLEHQSLEGARKIAQRLEAEGFAAWLVGGCVRDGLLGLPRKDFDLATSARPEQVRALFPHTKLVGARFGVVLVREGGADYEVATFRKDGTYLDHRHPEWVDYGTLEEDAARRDFTVNALFQHPETGELRDLVGGREDLHARVLRCVGDPKQRFSEDALRMLRAIRFATRLDFSIEPRTWEALRALSPTIRFIAPERQRDELTAMLLGPRPTEALRLLDASGLLEVILPEIHAMHGIEQSKAAHPEGDVFLHTLFVLEHLEPRDTIKVWGALLHDVGKPSTYRRDAAGKITFYEHEKVGAVMARQIMERLRFPADEVQAVETIVARHMQFSNTPHMRPATLRRFLAADTIEHELAVHRADCLGSSSVLTFWDFCRAEQARLAAQGEQVLPAPLITGRDLLALGIPAGPHLGELLRRVQDAHLNGEVTTPEDALALAQRLHGEKS